MRNGIGAGPWSQHKDPILFSLIDDVCLFIV